MISVKVIKIGTKNVLVWHPDRRYARPMKIRKSELYSIQYREGDILDLANTFYVHNNNHTNNSKKTKPSYVITKNYNSNWRTQ